MSKQVRCYLFLRLTLDALVCVALFLSLSLALSLALSLSFVLLCKTYMYLVAGQRGRASGIPATNCDGPRATRAAAATVPLREAKVAGSTSANISRHLTCCGEHEKNNGLVPCLYPRILGVHGAQLRLSLFAGDAK